MPIPIAQSYAANDSTRYSIRRLQSSLGNATCNGFSTRGLLGESLPAGTGGCLVPTGLYATTITGFAPSGVAWDPLERESGVAAGLVNSITRRHLLTDLGGANLVC